MADAVAELEGTLYQQLPALLQELQANHQNVAHIADWCGQTYVTPGEDKAATFERTQSYLKDALLTVAGHMTSAGASLTQTIDLQAVELESLDAMVRLIENRLAYQKEQLGRGAVSQQVRHRAFAPKTEAALEREPEQVRPVVDQLRDEKGRINFDALRDVGSTIPVGRGPSPSLGGGHAFRRRRPAAPTRRRRPAGGDAAAAARRAEAAAAAAGCVVEAAAAAARCNLQAAAAARRPAAAARRPPAAAARREAVQRKALTLHFYRQFASIQSADASCGFG